MSYVRVIPRDLFNESNLLKCLGQLYIKLELLGQAHRLEHSDDASHFDVVQDESSGALSVNNVELVIDGEKYPLERPLNSRAPYPLMVLVDDDWESVFNDDGTLSAAMLDLLTRNE